MPSFDVVSEIDMHEAANAVDQANREVSTRFDFKGSNAKYQLNDGVITLTAEAEFQLKQMREILDHKLVKRGVDIACMEMDKPHAVGKEAKQIITLRQGLDTLLAKKIVKLVKEKKLKVQAAIQGDKVRITAKKRDDLQTVIQLLKEEKLDMPLQFNNFRD